MSAIAGLFHFNKSPVSNEQTTDLMKGFERFPGDDVRCWQKSNAFLGCHAQWITPESVGEPLPYYDYERQLVITADAIIDNREELFEKLQIEKAYRQNIPDSRLILLAYSKWGEEAPKELIGDFAFMIWDERKQKLFGARDFSGARTLYYCFKEGRLAFSTLIAPLFTLPGINKKVNEEWMAEFLAIPGMVEAVDMNHTVYETIMQVPPSHSISVSERGVRISRYNVLNLNEKIKLKSDAEYEEAFRDVVGRAVKDRVRTYGKVGSHLSGGLDSGSVASFAAAELKKKNKQLHTFSFVPDNEFVDWTDNYYVPDERPFIKETVNFTGNIKDYYFSFDGRDPYSEMDDFLDIMEMPYKFFDNAYWLKGLNEEAAHKGVKVLLNGARGNHSVSWGSLSLTYDYYVSLLKTLRWMRLYKELNAYCQTFQTGKKVVLPFIAKRAIPTKTSKETAGLFPSIINQELALKTNVFEKISGHGMNPATGVVNSLNNYRGSYYLSPFTWNKSGTAETKLSLRYSLWNRDPTNDLRVIRYCLAIPEEQFTNNGLERSLIRRAMKNKLPDKVRINQFKRGLQGADTVHRMKRKWVSFGKELTDLVKDPVLSNYVDMDVVRDAVFTIKNADPKLAFKTEFHLLTRTLIVYRFIKNLERG
ncbi:asparagine synthase-related protein [Salipaludibacillus sp. CUR1]|uniref:asparagine synthase-related protein n=1 Tax=Salipaludibacillus sp. CUR1 TaxID=2820003 RepID=UPI001E476B1F|nr:asparagine synthase-related protein [Salipaludibacillus sp. CUR1]MCE7792760.1 asparagine synthase-related protein [Salipaludibacillus sp. CUR1]